ncbi:MAG: 3-phosphoserine/phosphohydroxythreonine transaminase [Pirellulales bacterium]
MSGQASQRIYNFSPGPAVLPVSVLEQVQRDLLCLPGKGVSILEMSHRDKAFIEILEGTQAALRTLLGIPSQYKILFLQGGSRLQFSMVPMNLLRGTGRSADYVLTGTWGQSACKEAQREGKVRIAWDGKSTSYDRLPAAADVALDPQAAYVHITSNETIEGVQFLGELDTGDVPLVADCSSDFLCRPLPIEKYGLIYACAQKNAGPAGVTIVIVREDLLARGADDLPGYLNFRSHAGENSLWNTPPTFAIYVVHLVTQWLLHEVGGLAAMYDRNREKAGLLYEVLDESPEFYRGHAQRDSRSIMNVTFRLPDADTEKAFLSGAEKRGLGNLKGHRSVGGIRASIYNAMPREGVVALRDYLREFRASRGG